jgi:shikimate kinase
MKRVLVTGMSGTGKSTVVRKLAELGYRTFDTDYNDLSVEVHSADGPERLWREDRIQQLLDTAGADLVIVSGTCRNQTAFYPQFDHIVLLSAPVPILVERLTSRSNNPYGKAPEELAETLRFVETVEPLLRAAATLEIDTTKPVDEVVHILLEHIKS